LVKDNTIVNSFKEANTIIHSIAMENGDIGYTKTAFIIEWVDGRTHDGRIDINSKHMNKSNPLGEHVKYFYENLAGMRKPIDWTWEQHKNHLKSIYQIDEQQMEEMKQILNTYLLDDVEENKPTPNNKNKNNTNVIDFTTITRPQRPDNNKPITASTQSNVVSLTDRLQAKQKQKEEREAEEKALTFVVNEILPFITPEEHKQMLTLSNDPDKFMLFLYELDLKIKLRNKNKIK
jgi:hypothetical protein